ncbi:MAG: DUF6079 family protein [Clostridiales bacterium]|nr:DUF6079 family protein [Clostridiales bacterium]
MQTAAARQNFRMSSGGIFPACARSKSRRNARFSSISATSSLNYTETSCTKDSVGIEFIATRELPRRVDDHFVNSIKALLQGFESVVIDTEDIMAKLDELGPCDVATFKGKLNSIVDPYTYTKGKDTAKLRIVVKRTDR